MNKEIKIKLQYVLSIHDNEPKKEVYFKIMTDIGVLHISKSELYKLMSVEEFLELPGSIKTFAWHRRNKKPEKEKEWIKNVPFSDDKLDEYTLWRKASIVIEILGIKQENNLERLYKIFKEKKFILPKKEDAPYLSEDENKNKIGYYVQGRQCRNRSRVLINDHFKEILEEYLSYFDDNIKLIGELKDD